MTRLLFLLLFLAGTQVQSTLSAQLRTDAVAPAGGDGGGVVLIGNSNGTTLRLRWAPEDFSSWLRLRRTGVNVYRHVITRAGKVLPADQRGAALLLNATPIFPAPLETFEREAPGNDYIAIGGQSLYGESFAVTSNAGDDPNVGALVDRAQEQTNRFGFGLYAADQDWRAANLMGLAFEDRNIVKNETYVYHLRPATPASETEVPLASITVSGIAGSPPAPVSEVTAEFGDRTATLSWNIRNAEQHYTSYFVERSGDGVTYDTVNPLPFVPLLPADRADRTVYFVDTLPANNRPYFYRIVGRTPFARPGTPSDPVQGMGLDAQPDSGPTMSSVFPDAEGGFIISWGWAGDEAEINGFRVWRAPRDAGPYDAISELLPPAARDFTDPAPLPSNYYRVTLYDKYDREMNTYAVLGQLNDTIPPAIPENLRGVILKDGRVLLTWDANTEPDLLGYRIWLSNQPEAEYSLASNQVERENYFTGRTNLNTLSAKLYAKIVSLDQRHNTSDFSPRIELLRPDTIPPAPPLMTDAVSSKDSLSITWAFSQSLDLDRQELQRRPYGGRDTSWTLLRTYPAPAFPPYGGYTEREVEVGKTYEYRVVAYDLSGLMSAAPKPISARRIDNFIRRPVGKVNATVDRREKVVNLQWNYRPEAENLTHFLIFRSQAEGTPVPIGRLDATAAATTRRGDARYTYRDDKQLKMDTEYRYQVRAVYRDGAISPLSEALSVSY